MERITYPLTSGQKVIGQSGQIFPGSAVNNIGGLLLLEDDLDFDLLQKTIQLCVSRNDALRLRLVKSDDEADLTRQFIFNKVRQYDTGKVPSDIPCVDFSQKTQQEMDDQIKLWNSEPIDVFESPFYEFIMVKSCDGRQGVFCKIDHMATDAWMSMMLCVEMIEVYYALKRGEELPPPAYSFIDYIAQEQAYLNSPAFAQDEAFWLSMYDSKPPATFINDKNEFILGQTGNSVRKTVSLDADLTSAVKAFCKAHSLSPATFFETLLAIYLYRLRDSTDVLFGSLSLLRSTLREKRTCGPLVNNLNIWFKLDQNKPFFEVCADINQQRLRMVRHMRYPQLNFLMNIYAKYNLFALWDCGMAYHVSRIRTREKVKSQVMWYSSGSFALPLYINVTDWDDIGRYIIHYEYHPDLFSVQQIDQIHAGLVSILQKGIEEPDRLLKNL